tara:strand:- start:112 stop:645 length:534 start_codon:yes stop_codon:yes gene_type:complete
MKLNYSIPNKIWWITNFLDWTTYKNIHEAVVKGRKNINFEDVEKTWEQNLYNNLTLAKRASITNFAPFEKLKTLIKHNPFFNVSKLNKITSTIHFMNKNSGINWHTDNDYEYGATFYLNNRWHTDWGGEFMFTDTKAHGFIPVVSNSLVIIKAPLKHKVNPVLTKTIPRMSVQLFIK